MHPIAIGVLGIGIIGGAFVAFEAVKKTPAQKVQATLDPHMPPPLQTAVTAAVIQSTDARGLATLAKKVEAQFPKAAAVVATRVRQLVAAASPSSSSTPTQAQPGDRMYTVVSGDSPIGIGKKVAGRSDPAMVRELAASNPDASVRINAGQLRVGERLKLPSSWLGTSIPSDTPIVTSSTYAVVGGDSPSKIAKKICGDGSSARVLELASANPSKKARILAGQISVYNATSGSGDLLVIPQGWRK